MTGDDMSLMIIAVCVAGVFWAARIRYRAEIAAGNTYAARWRVLTVAGTLLAFALMGAAMWGLGRG
jgi:hypothetical protein